MNAFSVELSSSFGFFNWGRTRGDYRVTNLFISPTEILGIFGAILGLEGYAQRNFKIRNRVQPSPAFFEDLKGAKISIIPQKKPEFYEDHLIHRSMGMVNKKGSLQVQMTGLVNPSYKVVVEQGGVSDALFEKLKTYVKNEWAEFVPYFGKNQFPVEVKNFKEEAIESHRNGEVTVDSLVKRSQINEQIDVDELDLLDGLDFFYSDKGKFFSDDGKGGILTEQIIWSSLEFLLDETYKTSDGETIVFL